MEKLTSRTKIFIGLSLIIFILIIGTTGYVLIDGFSPVDALYMTVITISTVGFKEVGNLSQNGKIFTIFLIISSFITYAYAITTISTHFFEGQLSYFISGYRIKSIKKMKNHVIICGFGRNGQQVALELSAHKQRFIVIDREYNQSFNNLEKKGIFITGDATNDETLQEANIDFAKALITTLPLDTDNLYIALSARTFNSELNIISRASDVSSEKKLKRAGVNSVVMPEKVGGSHMANLVARPDVIEFMEHVSVHGTDPTHLKEIACSELPEKIKNRTINELNIRSRSGVNIIGFKTIEGNYILNPTPDIKIVNGTKLFILGTQTQIDYMMKIFKT